MSNSESRLLIVDADDELRTILRADFSESGYSVIDTKSPQVGIYHLAREAFDAVLLDLHFPEMDGHAFLRMSASVANRPPIILMSGNADPQDVAAGFRAGIRDFLEKPFTPQQARETVRKAVGSEPRVAAAQPADHKRGVIDRLKKELASGSLKLPAPGDILTELSSDFERPDYGVSDLIKAVKKHPTCAARILKLVQSPVYATRSGPIKSLDTAVQRLGLLSTLNAVRTVILKESVVLEKGKWRDAARAMWENSIATAMLSKLIAEDIRHVSPETAYLAGLFHNVGESLLLRLSYELEQEGCEELSEAELAEELGAVHGDLGYVLCKHWQLDDTICETARNHHTEEQYEDSDRAAVGMLCATAVLGQRMATELQGQYLEGPPAFPDRSFCQDRLGISGESMNRLEKRGSEVVGEVRSVFGSD
jgi:HD-like signal output (HDOD) protein/CheY-like chemotaxis protein